MARHNREGSGTDQRGEEYTIRYQPDWLRWIKVTRTLESGRQSTKTLFRNPEPRQKDPGKKVRTRITSPEQDLDFQVVANDPDRVVRRIVVETGVPGVPEDEGRVVFTVVGENPPES